MAKKRGVKYEAIIDAAVKVIAADGYRNSSISNIAKAAGLGNESFRSKSLQ